MATKPAAKVKPAEEAGLDAIAYASVSGIPVADPHDLDRLGYNVWRHLSSRRESLEVAVRTAGARLQISEEEAVVRIRTALKEKGVSA
jgi:hypothetical protein